MSETRTGPARKRAQRLRPQHVARPGFNAAESPLGWLRQRKDKDGSALIAETEFLAGERLRADFHFAHMEPRVTASWSATARCADAARGTPYVGIELQDHVIAARVRVQRALSAVAPEHAGVLIDVCCLLKGLEVIERERGWPKRSGKIILQHGLRQLARHYGLDRTPQSEHAVLRTIRHWGSLGYRPSISGEAVGDETTL